MSRESEQQRPKAKKAAKADRPERRTARKTGPSGTGTGRTPRVRPMLTSRAAILALVMCVIALSLAYPLREYIAQRAQLAELREERARMEQSVRDLRQREEEMTQDSYVEREARVRLHYQYPGETAYIVIPPDSEDEDEADTGPSEPWFTALWRSVEEADSPPSDDGL